MPVSYLIVFASVVLSATAQIFFKAGVSEILSSVDKRNFLAAVLLSPKVWIGLSSFGISLLLWFLALRELPVSRAYPFVALGIVIVVLGGKFLLGETASLKQLVAIALVLGGLAMLANS